MYYNLLHWGQGGEVENAELDQRISLWLNQYLVTIHVCLHLSWTDHFQILKSFTWVLDNTLKQLVKT